MHSHSPATSARPEATRTLRRIVLKAHKRRAVAEAAAIDLHRRENFVHKVVVVVVAVVVAVATTAVGASAATTAATTPAPTPAPTTAATVATSTRHACIGKTTTR
jgi:hypothetical protein